MLCTNRCVFGSLLGNLRGTTDRHQSSSSSSSSLLSCNLLLLLPRRPLLFLPAVQHRNQHRNHHQRTHHRNRHRNRSSPRSQPSPSSCFSPRIDFLVSSVYAYALSLACAYPVLFEYDPPHRNQAHQVIVERTPREVHISEDISRYAAKPGSYDRLSAFQISQFFKRHKSTTKDDCNRVAANILKSPVSPTPIQVAQSYTVAADSGQVSKVIHFGSSKLNIELVEYARQSYKISSLIASAMAC